MNLESRTPGARALYWLSDANAERRAAEVLRAEGFTRRLPTLVRTGMYEQNGIHSEAKIQRPRAASSPVGEQEGGTER